LWLGAEFNVQCFAFPAQNLRHARFGCDPNRNAQRHSPPKASQHRNVDIQLKYARITHTEKYSERNAQKVMFTKNMFSSSPNEAVGFGNPFSFRECRTVQLTSREQNRFCPNRYFPSLSLPALSVCTCAAANFSPMGDAFRWGRSCENHLRRSALFCTRRESWKLNLPWVKRHKLRCEWNRELLGIVFLIYKFWPWDRMPARSMGSEVGQGTFC